MKKILSTVLFLVSLVLGATAQERSIQTTPYTRDLLKATTSASAQSKLGIMPSTGTTDALLVTPKINGGQMTNFAIMTSLATHTNVHTPTWGTLTYVNGQNYITVNASPTTAFTNILLYDYLRVGVEEYVVVGITNSNRTVAVQPVVSSSQTAVAFTLSHPAIAIYDNIPRQVGAMTDGGTYGITSYSIGNRGCLMFGDGYDTSMLENCAGSGTPNYFSISTGIGRGGGYAKQFIMQAGSLFNDLMILSNDDIAMRGGFTNFFGPCVISRQTIQAPQILTTNVVLTANPNGTTTAITASGTSGNSYVTLSGTASPTIQLYDIITLSGGNQAIVTAITNANNTIAIWPPLSATLASVAVNVQKSSLSVSNTTLGPVYGVTAAGNHCFGGPLGAFNTALGEYGLVFADGAQTTTMGNSGAGYFSISSGINVGGSAAKQFVMQNGALFNSILLYANSNVGFRAITNVQAGNLPINCGVDLKGDLNVTTVGRGLQLLSGSNAKIGHANANGTTAVVVSTTAITANSHVYLTIKTPGGVPGPPYISAVSAGTSFSFKSTSATDTSTVGWMIVEEN